MTPPNNLQYLTQQLLDSIDGIEEAWQEHLDYWGSEERHPYTDPSQIAEIIVDELARNNFSPLRVAATIVESALSHGSKSFVVDIRSSFIVDLHTRFVSNEANLVWRDYEQYIGPKLIQELKTEDTNWQGSSTFS